MLVSIYGRHLGPRAGCIERPYSNARTELCGVSVTVGRAKAGLLYVQDLQINQGRSSPPVPVRFAAYTALSFRD